MKKDKKTIKKKSFYFQDYNESEITDINKSKIVKVYLNRAIFLFFVFLSLTFIFGTKIVHLSLSSEKSFYITKTKSGYIKNLTHPMYLFLLKDTHLQKLLLNYYQSEKIL